MKKATSSKNAPIRHASELAAHFRRLLQEDAELAWRLGPGGGADPALELELELELDGRFTDFVPLYELKPSLPWLEAEALKWGAHAPAHPHEHAHKHSRSRSVTPLLVTPELSSRILEACKRLGISAIDLNGRCWLRAPGLLVDRPRQPGRSFTYDLEPRNIFTGKSARIVRCLLTDYARVWTQAEIVARTQASSGLVSRIIQHLIGQGLVEKRSAREFQLQDWGGLLDEWVEADHFAKRTRTTHYAGFLGEPQELAQKLKSWATAKDLPLAFTQWIAAWNRRPFTEPPLCSAYVPELPDPEALASLGLREVPDAGKLWLHVPDDEGILRETQICQGLPLATDAQIYLDLQRTGLRGPDAASALREAKDFCLP